MIHLKIICTGLAALTLSACIRTQLSDRDFPYHTRQPIDASAVAVGISMRKVEALFGPFPVRRVYFVRLEEREDILKQDRFIYSDASSNGYVYLMNTQPGRYAAVAFSLPAPASEFSRDLYLLPKALIQQTVTTVAPGTIGYLGDYSLGVSGMLKVGSDSIENHYASLLSGEYFNNFYVAELLSSTHDEQKKKQFLQVTDEEVLKKSGGAWSVWIQQQRETPH
jgi:hypothetical protein